MNIRLALMTGTRWPVMLHEGEGVQGTPAAPIPGGPPVATVVPPAAAAPPAAPWGDVAQPWKVADKPWYETYIPDGPTKEWLKTKNFDHPLKALDSGMSADKMVAQGAVPIPSVDDPPEKWNAFNDKMRGTDIKAPTDYKFSFGNDETGKPIEGDPGLVKIAQEIAFESGMSPKRAQSIIVDKWQKHVGEANTAYMAEQKRVNDAEVATTVQSWKDKGEDVDVLKAGGMRVVQSLGLDKTLLNKIEGAIGASAMLELFARIGKQSAEPGGLKGASNAVSDPNNVEGMTPEQAIARITTLQGDTAFQAKYTDAKHPEHAWAVQHMEKLYARTTPKPVAA